MFLAWVCKRPLTTPTELAMLGRVHTIAYIRLPIVEEYVRLEISSFSSVVVGHYLDANLK